MVGGGVDFVIEVAAVSGVNGGSRVDIGEFVAIVAGLSCMAVLALVVLVGGCWSG